MAFSTSKFQQNITYMEILVFNFFFFNVSDESLFHLVIDIVHQLTEQRMTQRLQLLTKKFTAETRGDKTQAEQSFTLLKLKLQKFKEFKPLVPMLFKLEDTC